MNKKNVVMLLMLGICIPAFSATTSEQVAPKQVHAAQSPTMYPCHCEDSKPTPLYRRANPVRKEMREKQIPQKIEKLFAAYEQLDGKQKETKKNEIVAEVLAVREAQLKELQGRTENVMAVLKEQAEHAIPQEKKFLQELLAKEKTDQEPSAKKAWVDEKTEMLIAADGDVKVLFGKPCNCPSRPMKMRKEQDKRFKATEEKMAKLVSAYKKASGKKQETKKAKIIKEVTAIRDAQLERNRHLNKMFAQRLEKEEATLKDSLLRAEKMQQHVKQKQAEKQTWAEEKTEKLIEAKGDIKVLFEREHLRGTRNMEDIRHKDGKVHHFKGHKHGKKDMRGPKQGKGPRMGEGDPRRVGINPPPPPPLEEK